MNIIVTMAGEGRRFREVGITTPKPMIQVRGKSVFEWAMESLQNFSGNPFFFIAQKKMQTRSFIQEKAKLLGIEKIHIKELDYLTKGQAETVLTIAEMIDDVRDPILIYNIDTFVYPEYLKQEYIRGAGWIPAFHAQGDHWSFVQFDKELRVTDIAEKARISPYATVGLYYFASFQLYSQVYEEYPFAKEERYIAPLYRLIIQNPRLNVYSHFIPKEAVHALGTPEEVRYFSLWKNQERSE